MTGSRAVEGVELGGDWPGLGWRWAAACRDEDPELWFADAADRDANMRAARVCATCPVSGRCLAWALETRQPYGIWGGVRAGSAEWQRRGGRPTYYLSRNSGQERAS